MPRKQTLKVFRTPIGFHDAYVAAPSQKAALEAWGSDADLFARGVAERVDDPELTREPLEKPGVIVRRLRGTAAEQLAALPPNPSKRRDVSKPESREEQAPRPRRARKAGRRAEAAPTPAPKPKPDRGALDSAEQALADLEARHGEERRELARKEAELDRERRAVEKRQRAESIKAEGQVERARETYERAMRAWRG